jgi:archaellum biogenesis protein FlaJ (TadC family)
MFNGYCDEIFLINITFVLFQIQGQLVCRKPSTHLRTLSDSMQKSSKYLIEIMTLVSSANMSIDEVFSVGGKSFIRLGKAKALKLNPGNSMPYCSLV